MPPMRPSPLLSATADVAGGNSYSLVAHLDADGKPTITPYANDISTISAGQTRLVVRHDAAAPAVDVRAGGTVVLAGVTNPAEGVLNIPAGTVTPMWCSPEPTPSRSGRQVLTWPRAARRSCTPSVAPLTAPSRWCRFVIPGLHSAPGGVPAGTGPADIRCTDHRPGRAADPRAGGRRHRWTAPVPGPLALTEPSRHRAPARTKMSRRQAATGLATGLALIVAAPVVWWATQPDTRRARRSPPSTQRPRPNWPRRPRLTSGAASGGGGAPLRLRVTVRRRRPPSAPGPRASEPVATSAAAAAAPSDPPAPEPTPTPVPMPEPAPATPPRSRGRRRASNCPRSASTPTWSRSESMTTG